MTVVEGRTLASIHSLAFRKHGKIMLLAVTEMVLPFEQRADQDIAQFEEDNSLLSLSVPRSNTLYSHGAHGHVNTKATT